LLIEDFPPILLLPAIAVKREGQGERLSQRKGRKGTGSFVGGASTRELSAKRPLRGRVKEEARIVGQNQRGAHGEDSEGVLFY